MPNPHRPRPPLNPASINELALFYVGRFATTRAKLAQFLRRKIMERGWSETQPPDIAAMVEKFAAAGYVDDAAYAAAKARSLTGRGYGARRVRQALQLAGVGEQDRAEADNIGAAARVDAALRFAQRRRLGPWGSEDIQGDRKAIDKGVAAMLRAGHGFALARAIVTLAPGTAINPESLSEFE